MLDLIFKCVAQNRLWHTLMLNIRGEVNPGNHEQQSHQTVDNSPSRDAHTCHCKHVQERNTVPVYTIVQLDHISLLHLWVLHGVRLSSHYPNNSTASTHTPWHR